jgi:hypothetical protein
MACSQTELRTSGSIDLIRPPLSGPNSLSVFALAGVFAMAGGAALANSKDGKCGFDSDCKGAKCRSGRCADAAGGSCAFDSDCGGGKCRSGKCANAPDGTCAFDSDCGGGRKCSSGKCK